MDDPLLLIDGELVPASGSATYDNINPATGRVIGVAPDASHGDIDRAAAAARRAFDESGWADDVALRVRCLRQLRSAFEAHADDIRADTVAEVGCPISLTYGAQLDMPVEGLGYAADVAEGYAWETDLGEAAPFGIRSRRTLRREPVAVPTAR